MRDADAGAREMARVTKPGGVVAECMWDIPGGGMTMLSTFWRAVRTIDPSSQGEAARVGVRDGEIADVLARAGLEDVPIRVAGQLRALRGTSTTSGRRSPTRSGRPAPHLATLAPEQQDAIRDECRRQLGHPEGPFDLDARAWYARGVVPG